MHVTAIRGVVALLGVAFLVAFSYYTYPWEGYTPVDPPDGRDFWLTHWSSSG